MRTIKTKTNNKSMSDNYLVVGVVNENGRFIRQGGYFKSKERAYYFTSASPMGLFVTDDYGYLVYVKEAETY